MRWVIRDDCAVIARSLLRPSWDSRGNAMAATRPPLLRRAVQLQKASVERWTRRHSDSRKIAVHYLWRQAVAARDMGRPLSTVCTNIQCKLLGEVWYYDRHISSSSEPPPDNVKFSWARWDCPSRSETGQEPGFRFVQEQKTKIITTPAMLLIAVR